MHGINLAFAGDDFLIYSANRCEVVGHEHRARRTTMRGFCLSIRLGGDGFGIHLLLDHHRQP